MNTGWLYLHQIVTESTRVTENTSTLLDHVFTSVPHKIRSVKVPRIGLSDHYPTCIVFKESFGRKHSHTTIKYRCYKNFDEKAFCIKTYLKSLGIQSMCLMMLTML